MSSTEMIKILNSQEIFFRIENDDDGFWITHVDRSQYPRIWRDNAVDNRPEIIAESVDNVIARCSPLAEKDWRRRVFNEDFDTAMKEFFEGFNFNPAPNR